MDAIEQIRAAHRSVRPNPAANPAWANAEKDIGRLLEEVDRLIGAESHEGRTPTETFLAWVHCGPALAKAAGLYVGIKIYASEEVARKAGDIT